MSLGLEIAGSLDFERARRAVEGIARRTPLLAAPSLGPRVLLKLESFQPTGSFKVRGAAARLAALDERERRGGVVACSSGNHGAAVAWVAGRLGIPAAIYVPEWVDPVKLASIRASGADTVLAGSTYDEAEARAIDDAGASGRPFVSAYDDPWVIAGQATLALEVLEQLGGAPEALLAPLSGGGLLGGIAAALATRGKDATRTVGVSAAAAAVMHASLVAGEPVELAEEETLASALAGGIGLENRWSFALVRDLVAEHVVVTEPEIERAMAFCARELRLVAEGGGAVGVAALLAGRWTPTERSGPVVVVLSGGNVSPGILAGVLRRC